MQMHSVPALAFDVYGTLVDPIAISAQLGRYLPDDLAHAGHQLAPSAQDALVARYNDLDSFPDAALGLARLRAEGYRLAVFSNGTPRCWPRSWLPADYESTLTK